MTAPAAKQVGESVLDFGLPPRPYPGLRPFKSAEWRIFCGRESVARELLYKLGEKNVVLVHGGSGCGKSSLIFAGVLPSLERKMKLAGSRLVSATIRPSQGPLSVLAATLAELLGAVPEAPLAQSQTGTGEAADGAARRTDAAGWTTALLFAPDIVERIEAAIAAKDVLPKAERIDLLCLVIDQFEEIFAWAREYRPSDVAALCRLLALLARPGAGRRLVIIATMRSDFIGQCALFPALGDVINTCQYFLPGLEDRMLERAIRDPAQLYGGTVDDALVTRLKTEANGTLDALPVLQHALMRMAAPKLRGGEKNWKLTLDDYRVVTTELAGGSAPPTVVSNALSVHAEEVRSGLIAGDPHGAEAVEAVFRALFESGAGGQLIRRPTAPDKLAELAGEASGAVPQVITNFAADGTDLLFEIKNPEGETIKIDVVHEALLRNWWRMKFGEKGQGPGWIEAETIDALVWRNLVFRAEDAEDALDRRALTRIAEPLARFRAAPARVERYLVRGQNRKTVTEEPEWLGVMALIERSERQIEKSELSIKRRKRLIEGAAILLLLGLVAVAGNFVFSKIQESKAQGQTARQKQKVTRTINSVVPNSVEETTLNTYQGDLIVQITADDTSSASNAQYIWFGDETSSNITEIGSESTVAASEVVKGRRYRVTANLALRAAMPDVSNSSQRTGALLAGTPVIALAPPQKAANGQYWLKITPIQLATVYIQYASGDPATKRQQLIDAGFKVPPAQRLDSATDLNEVRFCNKADATSARAVATALAAQRGAPPPQKYIGDNPACSGVVPGIIEVWIGAPGVPATRAKSGASAPPPPPPSPEQATPKVRPPVTRIRAQPTDEPPAVPPDVQRVSHEDVYRRVTAA